VRHQPKKLALLISLIGAGVSPLAYARIDALIVAPAQSALGTALEAPAATALDRTRWSPGLTWRTEEDALDLAEPQEALRAVSPLKDEWAPGEVPEQPQRLGQRTPRATPDDRAEAPRGTEGRVEDETAAAHPDALERAAAKPEAVDTGSRPARVAEAGGIPSNPKASFRGRLHRVRVLMQDFSAKHASVELESSPAIVRSARLPVPMIAVDGHVDARPPAPAEAGPQGVATIRFSASPSVQADAEPTSSHADRLMESLAAVLLEDVTTLSHDVALSKIAERFPAAIVEPPLSEPQAAVAAPGSKATAQRIERRNIVVAPQSSKVLRSLEAILSGERDEVGAIRGEPSEKTVATEAEKVLATLFDVSSVHNEREDGAARRIRKLAAAKLRAEAAAAATAEVAVAPTASTADAGTPDRAETLAVSTPIAVAVREAMGVDIDLTLPFAGHAATASSIGDDSQVSIAVEPPPLPMVAAAPDPERKVRPSPFGSERVAMSEKSLDGVRGGFITDGLNISFGIERAIYINGALVTTTSLNLSDLGRISAGRGTTAFDTGTIALIQSGAGNTVSSGAFSAASVGNVIQNALDGQKIQNVTVINATVNSLGVLRGLNLESSLRGALIDSLRR
jgi:hypothetical protein